MPTIALVDDDRNILTSVSMALEAEGYQTSTTPMGGPPFRVSRTTRPMLPFSTSRCRAWTDGAVAPCASAPTCR